MSLIWGLPYFFIKVAVDELSPAFVAWSRVVLAVAVVLPLAWGWRPSLRSSPASVARCSRNRAIRCSPNKCCSKKPSMMGRRASSRTYCHLPWPEPIVHESGAVHRLDRRPNRRAMTRETLTQAVQPIRIRRCCADVDSRTPASSRWKSRRLRLRSRPAYNMKWGLLSIAPRRQAGACHPGRPFFMAFLTI
jgi:hypothetical protein